MKTSFLKTFAILSVVCSFSGNAIAQNIAPLIPCDNVKAIRPSINLNGIEDRESGLQTLPPNALNCDKGVRLEVDASTNLWRCRINHPDDAEIKDGDWSQAFLIMKNGQIIKEFEDDVMAEFYENYGLYQVDLDKDGSVENIVALWVSQGNGLGENTWTIRVFNQDWQEIGEKYLASDWGPSGIVKSIDGQTCEIAITSLVNDTTRRMEGLAYEAHFVKLQNGQMVDDENRPDIRRRYTFNFEKQRETYQSQVGRSYGGDPAAWLSRGTFLSKPN